MARRKRLLGFGFSDEVAKVTSKTGSFQKNGHSKNQESPDWIETLLPNFRPDQEETTTNNVWRIIFFSSLCLILFFFIFLRLFHLQIIQGKVNRGLADGNRIQIKIIHAPRGVIFDRNDKILAANSPAFRLISSTSSKPKLITREEALAWEVKSDSKESDLEVDNVRAYPTGELFAHVVGVVGQISEEQLKEEKYKSYRLGDQIGKTGIEAQYEKILRGIDGGEIIEVDSMGRKIRTLRLEPPISGQNIHLSLDAQLQEKLFKLMKEAAVKSNSCCGAAVASDPASGKILAMVSVPSYDPNLFTQGDNDGAISEIFSRSDSPMLNRVIGGTYPPGSTFKIISSLAALASGKVSAGTIIQDNGVMNLGPYKFTNWYFNQYGKTEGSVDLAKALQRSNDTYFYGISQIIGEAALVDWSRKLRLGGKLDIDLPGEETGLVPDDEWKQKNYGQPWYPGDTLHMSIGQGFVLTTPLQVLGFTSYIATDGVLYKPELTLNERPKILASNLASKEQIKLIKDGLKLVPKDGGTAWPFFNFPIRTAGKTGTAEYGDPKDKTHAWYTSFAPADDPKIVLTVLVEGGGEGSSVASPIAKELYRYYFSPDKNKLIQDNFMPSIESAKVLGE